MLLHRTVITFGITLAVNVAGLGFLPATNDIAYTPPANAVRVEGDSSKVATVADSSAEGATQDIPKVRMEFLTHFIVVPEHKLLFCYMEKVGCTNFNNLFRFLRERYDPSQREHGPWQLNNPTARGIGNRTLEDMLTDKSWHKAVFYREPLERFVSAYKSKCEGADGREGHSHCKHMFGNETVPFDEAVDQIRDFDANHMDDVHAEKQLDEHFRLQADFCGGLADTLRYYDTVEELDRDTAHAKVTKLLATVGVQAESIPNFTKLFPPPGDDRWERKRHNTNSADQLGDYLPEDKPALALALMRHYRRDYETFNISTPEWALNLRAGRDDRAMHATRRSRTQSPFLAGSRDFAAALHRVRRAPRWPL